MDAGVEARQLAEARQLLQAWRAKVEKADDEKARLILEKLEGDDAKMKAQQEMVAHVQKQEACQKEFNDVLTAIQADVLDLGQRKQDLLAELRRCQAELQSKRAESTKLERHFKISAQIPDRALRFAGVRQEGADDDSRPIRAVFAISQRVAARLQGGQALVTFEEAKVASQILKLHSCTVSCEQASVVVKPRKISMDPAVKFEIHLDVSKRDLKVSQVPALMPGERVKERLELSFSRPSRGGGEVERVEYEEEAGSGKITFLHPGVAENLVQRGRYPVDLGSEVSVHVGPVYNFQLHQFQTFCGVPKRTILLDDIEDVEDEEDLLDHLEIHFQKPSNCGGEIEAMKYVSGGNALLAFFCDNVVD